MMGVYILILYVFIFWDYSTLHFKWKLPAFIFYMQNSLSEIPFILIKMYLSRYNRNNLNAVKDKIPSSHNSLGLSTFEPHRVIWYHLQD